MRSLLGISILISLIIWSSLSKSGFGQSENQADTDLVLGIRPLEGSLGRCTPVGAYDIATDTSLLPADIDIVIMPPAPPFVSSNSLPAISHWAAPGTIGGTPDIASPSKIPVNPTSSKNPTSPNLCENEYVIRGIRYCLTHSVYEQHSEQHESSLIKNKNGTRIALDVISIQQSMNITSITSSEKRDVSAEHVRAASLSSTHHASLEEETYWQVKRLDLEASRKTLPYRWRRSLKAQNAPLDPINLGGSRKALPSVGFDVSSLQGSAAGVPRNKGSIGNTCQYSQLNWEPNNQIGLHFVSAITLNTLDNAPVKLELGTKGMSGSRCERTQYNQQIVLTSDDKSSGCSMILTPSFGSKFGTRIRVIAMNWPEEAATVPRSSLFDTHAHQSLLCSRCVTGISHSTLRELRKRFENVKKKVLSSKLNYNQQALFGDIDIRWVWTAQKLFEASTLNYTVQECLIDGPLLYNLMLKALNSEPDDGTTKYLRDIAQVWQASLEARCDIRFFGNAAWVPDRRQRALRLAQWALTLQLAKSTSMNEDLRKAARNAALLALRWFPEDLRVSQLALYFEPDSRSLSIAFHPFSAPKLCQRLNPPTIGYPESSVEQALDCTLCTACEEGLIR